MMAVDVPCQCGLGTSECSVGQNEPGVHCARQNNKKKTHQKKKTQKKKKKKPSKNTINHKKQQNHKKQPNKTTLPCRVNVSGVGYHAAECRNRFPGGDK